MNRLFLDTTGLNLLNCKDGLHIAQYSKCSCSTVQDERQCMYCFVQQWNSMEDFTLVSGEVVDCKRRVSAKGHTLQFESLGYHAHLVCDNETGRCICIVHPAQDGSGFTVVAVWGEVVQCKGFAGMEGAQSVLDLTLFALCEHYTHGKPFAAELRKRVIAAKNASQA